MAANLDTISKIDAAPGASAEMKELRDRLYGELAAIDVALARLK